MKTRKCKGCDNEIPKKGKVICPSCGTVNKKPFYTRWWFITIAVFILLGAIGSSGDSEAKVVDKTDNNDTVESNDNTNTDTATETEEPKEQTSFAIGDVVNVGDLNITLNSVHFDNGNDFTAPEEGQDWLVINMTIENLGDEEYNMSSILTIELYDDESYQKDWSIWADTEGSLDGEIAAGKKMRGEMAFDVDESNQYWELYFDGTLFSGGDTIVWKIDRSSVTE